MTKKAATFNSEPYSRILIPNPDGTYSAEILEFPGCFAVGKTADETLRNLEMAAESWMEAAKEAGQTIPEPAVNAGYSGHIALRLPRSLHRQAARMADRDGTSLNQFLVTAVSARIGAEDFFSHLAERFEQRITVTYANMVIPAGDLQEQFGTRMPSFNTTAWLHTPAELFGPSAPFQLAVPKEAAHG